jgi:hypothetical protein
LAERESGLYLEVDLYPYPNPALTEVLVGDRMEAIVADYTAKVAAVFVSSIAGRSRRGDKHPGLMAEGTYANTHVGGFKNDRIVGEVGSTVDYMGADEFGRKSHNPYEGHHDLTHALYSVLPYAP